MTIVSTAAISYFVEKTTRLELLKQHDIALNNLQTAFTAKHKSFNNTLSALFQSVAGYNELCAILSADTPEQISSFSKKYAVDILTDVCGRDTSCVGALLYSSINNTMYRYDIQTRTISSLPQAAHPPAFLPFQLEAISHQEILAMYPSYVAPVSHVYGLVGTIYERYDGTLHAFDALDALGNIILLYTTSELSAQMLQSSPPQNGCVYSLTDSRGHIFYASNDEYSDASLLYHSTAERFTLENSTTPARTVMLNGKPYSYASLYNGRYDFSANYQLSADAFRFGDTTHMILVFGIVICCFSLALYIITMRLSAKKVAVIERGMQHIGTNNLDYRIPVPQEEDEFSQIIEGFNRMCDELQSNVEKSYIFALQQKKAELYALQTSINPHFLYNTLEIIRVQVLNGNKNDASQMIMLLSKIYRNLIKQEMFVSLRQEMLHCENIICLYQYRYANFEYDFSLDDDLLCFTLPRNCLQPIIENYFVHGIDSARTDNLLKIYGEFTGEGEARRIRLICENNGRAITPDACEKINRDLSTPALSTGEESGFALSNVNSRLRIAFGEHCGLSVSAPESGEGFRINLVFPPVLPQDAHLK